ncbi:hypothetical protein ACMD2_08146, partial [Ananas comosus]
TPVRSKIQNSLPHACSSLAIKARAPRPADPHSLCDQTLPLSPIPISLNILSLSDTSLPLRHCTRFGITRLNTNSERDRLSCLDLGFQLLSGGALDQELGGDKFDEIID